MSDPFVGEIRIFSDPDIFPGWAICDGSTLNVSQQSLLFAVIGARFGGDGRFTFALPDLRGRSPIGIGGGPETSNYQLGQAVGVTDVYLDDETAPTHTHPVYAAGSRTTPGPTPIDGIALAPSLPDRLYKQISSSADLEGQNLAVEALTPSDGESDSHDNTQPFLPFCFAISLLGAFPQPGE